MKVGDLVAIICNTGVETIVPIERETKRYWCAFNRHFRKDRLSCNDGWKLYRIEPATQQHYDQIEKKRLITTLRNTEWSQFDYETLLNVQAVLCGLALKQLTTKEKQNE